MDPFRKTIAPELSFLLLALVILGFCMLALLLTKLLRLDTSDLALKE